MFSRSLPRKGDAEGAGLCRAGGSVLLAEQLKGTATLGVT